MKRAAILATAIVFALTAFKAFGETSYKSALRAATKGEALYDLYTGNAKILWKATLFTDDFRRAFAQKHAEIHYLGPEETAAVIAEQEYLQDREWEVFISMFTPKDYKKFSLRPDTFWSAYLITADGESIAAISVKETTITPYWRVMFPHITKWSRAYRVVFPKVPLGNEVTLTMQSVVGYTSVTWPLKE